MTTKDIIFHLLDSSVRDVLIEEETESSKKIVYEPVEEDEDSDGNKRRRRYNAAEKKEFIIHLFGCTADGVQVRVDVEGFRPTLYLRLPETKTLAAIDTLRAYMAGQGVPLSQVTLKQVQRKQFYGFTAETLYPFLEITVPSLALMRTVKNLFLDGDSCPKTRKALGDPFKRGHKVEVYEANLDPMLRFFHVQLINPCGWLEIKDIDLEDAAQPDGSLVLGAHYTDILAAAAPQPSAPFKRVSWDIECYSRTGDFPVAKKEWSKVAEYVMKNASSMIPIRTTIQTLFDSGAIGQLKPKKTLKQLDTKLKSAAFDTWPTTQEECATLLKGQLGDVLSIGDPVIQIGASIVKGEALEKHLFVWPTCDAIDEIEVHAYANEKAMIEAWFEWLVSINPDILIGYNVFGFDERYLWQRAEDLGCTHSAQGLTRVPESEVVCEEKRLSSSAMGDNFLYMWTTLGRLQIDLFHYIKRNNASLPSYKLDEVTKYYLSGKLKKATKLPDGRLSLTLSGAVKDLRIGRAMCLLEHTGEDLTDKMVIEEVDGPTVTVAWPLREDGEALEEDQLGDAAKWVIVKDDVSPADIFRLHKGTAADRAKVGKYCLQDCDLVLELYKNLEVFNNSMSMANVCCVPIGYIFTRGQGIKAESLMFKACRERNVLIPVLPRPGQGATEDSYEGAIVFDPVPGFYRKSPIGVADFASLYPSTMESENISHDSLVWAKDYDDSGALIGVVFGSDEFDGRNGYGYTDIEFDRFRVADDDKRKHPEKVKAGKRVCRFAQPLDGSKATVPEIIRGLLAARKAKRKEKAKETDPGRQALLEAEQLAYKLTANSLYGQLGSGTFKVRMQNLAASVTAYGRKQIMFAKEVIDHFYGPEAKDPRCVARCEAKVMYGDSVTGDTPLLLQKEGAGLFLCRIDELERLDCLSTNTWSSYHDTKESIVVSGLSTWTERGWTPIHRLIRHRLAPGKKLLRILTHTGVADVTEDHSLVLANGAEAKPGEIMVGTELLHNNMAYQSLLSLEGEIGLHEAFVMGLFVADGSSDVYVCPSGIKATWAINKADMKLLEEAKRLCPFETKILDTIESSGVYKLIPVGSIAEPARRYRRLFYNTHREKRVPGCILNAPIAIVEAFWNGFYAGDGDKDKHGYIRIDQKGKEISAGLALLAMRLGYKVSITDRADKQDVFRCTMTTGKQRKNLIAVKKIRELPHPGPDVFVYDLETENHHFGVGPGSLIVHNTDSLFVEFNPKNPETGEALVGREARQAVIDLTAEAGKLVTKALPPPHDFEFDKVFDPMLMFSKKRYAGHMFEENADDYVTKYMGIALKRRDNAPIVKTIYGTAMKKLLLDRDIAGSTAYVQQACLDLVQGKVKMGQLTITKSLRAEYANPIQIAHKVLADRMALRDPGNAPASGDRIPYVYVKPAVGAAAAKLQGDRIEAPSYIKTHGLMPDYEFYLGHQIQNPVSQMFGLVLEEMPGSETVPWSKAPTDNPDRLLLWREEMASHILFDKAFQACGKQTKAAFVTTFFGLNAGPSVTVSKPTTTMNKASTTTKKPTQTALSNFMVDTYLIKNINKVQNAKRRAKEKAVEDAAASNATSNLKPKNEIILSQ